MLAIVQFSSFAEDDRWVFPTTRSLRTEQRFGNGTRPLRNRVQVDISGSPADRGLATDSWLPFDRSRERAVLELPRKEVIQPQLPLRLPCYDFTPITSPTFGGCLP